jgi:hypothetical protein
LLFLCGSFLPKCLRLPRAEVPASWAGYSCTEGHLQSLALPVALASAASCVCSPRTRSSACTHWEHPSQLHRQKQSAALAPRSPGLSVKGTLAACCRCFPFACARVSVTQTGSRLLALLHPSMHPSFERSIRFRRRRKGGGNAGRMRPLGEERRIAAA